MKGRTSIIRVVAEREKKRFPSPDTFGRCIYTSREPNETTMIVGPTPTPALPREATFARNVMWTTKSIPVAVYIYVIRVVSIIHTYEKQPSTLSRRRFWHVGYYTTFTTTTTRDETLRETAATTKKRRNKSYSSIPPPPCSQCQVRQDTHPMRFQPRLRITHSPSPIHRPGHMQHTFSRFI